jgi:hypothetical protein
MESRVTRYANGPLPEHLEHAAYFTVDRKEWALPKAEAILYLDWCEREDFKVLGFDVWYPTSPDPTVADLGIGNIEGIAATLEGIQQHPGCDVYGPVVFNIWVVEHGSTPTAG